MAETLREMLSRYTAPGELVVPIDDGWVQCLSCGHRCRIGPGKEGICRVRYNDAGVLRVPRGYIAGIAIDPIEKKPFFHVFPGSTALSFGMLGCDYHCDYCQNWVTSQALRDPAALPSFDPITAAQIVSLAVRHGAPVITSTYNEPLITSEWAAEIFALARTHGLLCSCVSNGNGTPEVLEYLRPHIQLFKVDLKSFRRETYRKLGGKLEHVLETIRTLKGWGIWVEVVTLLIPGFNDSEKELVEIAEFLASVSPDLPWHVTAFRAGYRMNDPDDTPPASLMRAAAVGRAAGLRYVYAGNLPGMVAGLENTVCPFCSGLLIERSGFGIRRNNLENGRCPSCRATIPGVWAA